MSRNLRKPRDGRVMLIYEKEPMKINYRPAKFGGHTYCGSKHTTLMCHMILQVVRLYGQEPVSVSYHPAKFCSHWYSDGEDVVVLVCLLISQYHVCTQRPSR